MGNISKINTNGYTTARPGAYLEELEVAPESERPLSPGKFLALVGAFDFLEGGKAHEVTSAAAMRQLCPKSTLLRKMTGCSYAPSPTLAGAPEKVMLATTMTTTQASMTILDDQGNDSVVLKSRLWGPWGNRVMVSFVDNADDPLLRDVTISRDGVVETYDGLGSGNLIRLFYVAVDGVATTVEVAYAPTTGLTLISKYTPLAAGSLTGVQCARIMVGGVVKGTPSGAQTGANTATLTVTGLDSTGAAVTGTAPWALADGTTQKTVQADAADVTWSSVTGVTWATEEGGITVSLEFHKIFSPSEFGTFKDVVEYITEFANGYNVSEDSELASVVKLTEADAKTQTPLGVTLNDAIAIRADVWALVDTVNRSSKFVSASVPTTDLATRKVPLSWVNTRPLSGGSATGGTSTASFEDALTRFYTLKPHIYWIYNDSAAVHAVVRTHINYMTGPGRGECCAWVASASGETREQLKTRTKALNTRHLAIVAQDVEFETDRGPEWHDPVWLALYGAATQAIVGVAEPLSNGYTINASNVRNTAWDFDNEIEGLIEERVTLITSSDIGLKWERPLTTYRSTGDPSLTELSANESIFMNTRDVRENIEALGISRNVESNGSRIVSLTKTRLRLQIKAGWIASADFSTVALRQESADAVSNGWDFVPAVPVNFVGLRPRVRRGSFTIGG